MHRLTGKPAVKAAETFRVRQKNIEKAGNVQCVQKYPCFFVYRVKSAVE